MPELPEVETARRLVHRHGLGRRIAAVLARRDPLVFPSAGPTRLRRQLLGADIHGTERRGKHFWIELGDRGALAFHLGMSGRIAAHEEPAPRPRFWKLVLHLDDGSALSFADARRLGRVRLMEDPMREPPICELGFDPILEPPTPARWRHLLAKRQRTIKGLLLDQGFIAGVGNWIADEVLYQSRIAPHRPASSLDADEATRLRSALLRVIRRAIDDEADDSRFPRNWLFHRRWGKRCATTPRGEPLAFTTVAGRTTAWVPSRQR